MNKYALAAATTLLTVPFLTTPFFTQKSEAQTFRQINCSTLQGAGTFSSPKRIGTISQPTVVVGCSRLTSGYPYNRRYFSFNLSRPATSNSAAGALAYLRSNERSAVHPRLASPNGNTLRTSMSHGYWNGNPEGFGWVGRYLPLRGLGAGSYVFGVEKLDSPLRSIQTPNFNLVIVP